MLETLCGLLGAFGRWSDGPLGRCRIWLWRPRSG